MDSYVYCSIVYNNQDISSVQFSHSVVSNSLQPHDIEAKCPQIREWIKKNGTLLSHKIMRSCHL